MKNILLVIAFIFTFPTLSNAQEDIAMLNKKSNIQDIKVKLKENTDQVFYIDGKKYDSDIFNILDHDKIETITVLKGEEAIKKYGEPNVVIITTKKDIAFKNIKFTINEDVDSKKSEAKKEKVKERITIKSFNFDGLTGPNVPVFVVDGEIQDGKRINEIMPIDISSIKILKDEKTKKKYNTEVGVIFVITKEGKKLATTLEYSDDSTSKEVKGHLSFTNKEGVVWTISPSDFHNGDNLKEFLSSTNKDVEEKSYFSFINKKGAAKELLGITGDIDKNHVPVIIVNGEIKNEAYLEKLDPDTIRKIKVLADQKSIEKYNTKYGVIIVKLKGW